MFKIKQFIKKGFNFWSEKNIYNLVFNTDYFK